MNEWVGRIRIEGLTPDCIPLTAPIIVAVVQQSEVGTGVRGPLNGRGGDGDGAPAHHQTENLMEGQG